MNWNRNLYTQTQKNGQRPLLSEDLNFFESKFNFGFDGTFFGIVSMHVTYQTPFTCFFKFDGFFLEILIFCVQIEEFYDCRF